MAHRILFVDDEESLRTLVRTQLEGEGFEVDTAEDGIAALDAMQQKTYDLVLLDIRMPRMDGVGVLERLKADKKRPRIIMLTAVDDVRSAIDAVKRGANDYLTKPYDINELLVCINRVLAR